MILEVHDIEVGNTLTASIKNIDYDYMAEQWVQDLVSDAIQQTRPNFPWDQIILNDDIGVRAIWKIHENLDAELIQKSDRFTGEWVLNHRFVPK